MDPISVPRTDWREQSIAPPASGEAQTFRVTHPFHPLHGRTFPLVDCRQTWGEDRVYFHDDSGQLARLPLPVDRCCCLMIRRWWSARAEPISATTTSVG